MSVYDETEVLVSLYAINLLWKPLKGMVRFVLVNHPTRGKAIFMSSDLTLDPLLVLRGYGYRFKIEVAFKSALHTIGAYTYHFWMKTMDPIKRYSGDQYMHKKTDEYRQAIRRKTKTFHVFIATGCIAQGLLLHLCMNHAELVWKKFGSWIRTMNTKSAPSEFVAANALRRTLSEFIESTPQDHPFTKFLIENTDSGAEPLLRKAG